MADKDKPAIVVEKPVVADPAKVAPPLGPDAEMVGKPVFQPTSTAMGTDSAPIHLEPTSSPQGSLTVPRPDDGTFDGKINLLDTSTGRHIDVAPKDGPAGIPEANISSVMMPVSA